MPSMTLVRGIPGSGKSTYARSLARGLDRPYHVEADMYFVDEDGKYNFEPQLISYAHQWCQARARDMHARGYDVIVSNTFTQLWEMQPYFDMVGGHKNCTVYRCMGEFENVHGVPKKAISKMKNRFESFGGETYIFPPETA